MENQPCTPAYPELIQTPRYLIVEDQQSIATVVALALNRRGELSHHEPTLEGALKYLADHQPPLVISDFQLHPGTGVDLYERVKDRRIPFLFMSGTFHDPIFTKFRSQLHWPDYHFLPKPFRAQELYHSIDMIRGASK